jgi:hypothetical protein
LPVSLPLFQLSRNFFPASSIGSFRTSWRLTINITLIFLCLVGSSSSLLLLSIFSLEENVPLNDRFLEILILPSSWVIELRIDLRFVVLSSSCVIESLEDFLFSFLSSVAGCSFFFSALSAFAFFLSSLSSLLYSSTSLSYPFCFVLKSKPGVPRQ